MSPLALAQENAEIPDSAEKDYSSELPRLPPKSPEEAVGTFDVQDGFRVELVASEPLVVDPIAFAFDAHYRLFVVEMRDYSEQETEHLGRIALLEDTDGDGRMDKRSTFVEGLSWPTAIWPWKDGVLVGEPPRITWYRDTDGDGKSDVSEDWFVGFGRSNVQGLVNSLRWGVDGYVHGATSSSGADVDQLVYQQGEDLNLRRRDFVIDPLTREMQPESGGGQHGMSFNRWGDKFATSNSDHLQQIVDIESWLSEHSSSVPLPASRRSIAEDGPQAEVYRSSPVEPWRIVRTRLRMSGVAPGVVEGGGRAAGYFTGATGTWILDSELGFGDPEYDTAIVCDVGSNLVHRKRMIDHGLYWSGQRIDKESELFRSTDTWFRPAQIGDGPQGELIVADMYREVIEHPKSLPPMIKKHLDLTSGRDRGRIWRLVPEGWTAKDDKAPADLSSKELVARLSHPVAWQRRTASQLLVERQAKDVAAELRAKATDTSSPEAQVLAMHVASRLGLFNQALAKQLLTAKHERVLQHALQLVRINDLAGKLSSELLAVGDRQEPRVQMELALVAGDIAADNRDALFSKLFAGAKEPMVRAIVATAAADASWQLLDRAAGDLSPETLTSWLELLLPVWSKQMQSDTKLQSWLIGKLAATDDSQSNVWLAAISDVFSVKQVAGLRKMLSADQREQLDEHIESQIESALESGANSESRYRIVRLVSPDTQLDFAEELLEPTNPGAAQRAAIGLAAWSERSELSELVLSKFASMTPGLQADGLRALAGRSENVQLLAAALESQSIRASQIPLEIREQLLRVGDDKLVARLKKLLGSVSADRQAVIDRYAADMAGQDVSNTAAGQEIFVKVCAQCHRLGEVGNDVGPPLKQLGDKSPQQLLEIILDPNREIDPKYASYSVLLADGSVLAGIIQDESAGQVTLKEAGGKLHTIARSDIDQIKSNGVSLMPNGLEENITPEQ
ncbi:MAG: c-type cytochrome, partial [Planctomycetales bacterium]|nr:c-type cytochrome [Planctomycetales bacterium]